MRPVGFPQEQGAPVLSAAGVLAVGEGDSRLTEARALQESDHGAGGEETGASPVGLLRAGLGALVSSFRFSTTPTKAALKVPVFDGTSCCPCLRLRN